MNYRSLAELQQALQEQTVQLEAVVHHYLDEIESQKHLNVFLEVYREEALASAAALQKKLNDNKPVGKLFGLIVGIKDVLAYKGHSLWAGSKILDGFESQFTATAIERLLAEDAIIIGRQNCDEFAMGSTNENSAYGPTLNAADNSKVPGGSSGASAVSVQAGLCMAAIGSDTGGSVRQPAAFCGVIGIKPTYSRISRHGLVAYASSFDCIGIFTHTIEDNAAILSIIAGKDEYDSTVSNEPVPDYGQRLNFEGTVKVAFMKETLDDPALQPEIKQAVTAKIKALRMHGHIVEEISFPHLEYLLPTYYILTTAEASSNLSRYDGVKYGYRTPEVHSLEKMYKLTRSEAFGEEVKRRIMLGTFVLSASYFDAYYTKAQQVRRIIRDETRKVLSTYDFIILPTTPTTAIPLNSQSENPAEMYLADIFTVQANVAGIPAISIPAGKDNNNMPIGVQLMTDLFKEDKLYAFSKHLMEL